jgi:hypothetical protein
MSHPREPEPVKLVSSLFSSEKELLETTIGQLSALLGPADLRSPGCFFDRTRYYAREMGWPLHRLFVSFSRLLPPEQLVAVKLKTNELERQSMHQGNRGVNIDPGYVALERLILATGKNYVHRVYLSKGIYGDLTLVFRKGTFTPLPWTYPDYANPEAIVFFNRVREKYHKQLREMKTID